MTLFFTPCCYESKVVGTATQVSLEGTESFISFCVTRCSENIQAPNTNFWNVLNQAKKRFYFIFVFAQSTQVAKGSHTARETINCNENDKIWQNKKRLIYTEYRIEWYRLTYNSKYLQEKSWVERKKKRQEGDLKKQCRERRKGNIQKLPEKRN